MKLCARAIICRNGSSRAFVARESSLLFEEQCCQRVKIIQFLIYALPTSSLNKLYTTIRKSNWRKLFVFCAPCHKFGSQQTRRRNEFVGALKRRRAPAHAF